jgi:co-chaperonin GroES (HSP10)
MSVDLQVFSRLRIYGERLAIISLEDGELLTEGDIITPDSAHKEHYFVRVVAKGDGLFRGIEQKTAKHLPDVVVGDIVMVQIQPALARDAAIDVAGHKVVVLHWGDAICKILDEKKPVSSHNVQPVGKWVFTESSRSNKVGELYLPDTSIEGELTTRLVGVGATADMEDVPVGTRVYVNMGRANPFRLGDMIAPEIVLRADATEIVPRARKLEYIDASFVMGWEDE